MISDIYSQHLKSNKININKKDSHCTGTKWITFIHFFHLKSALNRIFKFFYFFRLPFKISLMIPRSFRFVVYIVVVYDRSHENETLFKQQKIKLVMNLFYHFVNTFCFCANIVYFERSKDKRRKNSVRI